MSSYAKSLRQHVNSFRFARKVFMAPEDLGKFLKRRREDLKLKQQEISEMTGFTRSKISLIENNSKSLRYDELLKFWTASVW